MNNSRKRTRIKRCNGVARQDGRHRQTPGSIQKQPCRLPEETCVQLMCVASYDIMVQRPGHWPNKHRDQHAFVKDENGKTDAQYHIQRTDVPTSGSERERGREP